MDIFRSLADKLNIQYDFTYDWEKINIKIDRYNRVH
jgi:hypothetical protein